MLSACCDCNRSPSSWCSHVSWSLVTACSRVSWSLVQSLGVKTHGNTMNLDCGELHWGSRHTGIPWTWTVVWHWATTGYQYSNRSHSLPYQQFQFFKPLPLISFLFSYLQFFLSCAEADEEPWVEMSLVIYRKFSATCIAIAQKSLFIIDNRRCNEPVLNYMNFFWLLLYMHFISPRVVLTKTKIAGKSVVCSRGSSGCLSTPLITASSVAQWLQLLLLIFDMW